MKNIKGFTLIELLAVIIILLIILSIAVPPLMNVLTSSRSKTYEVTVNTIEKAAKFFVAENPEKYTQYSGDDFVLSINNLCDSGHLVCPLYNPDTDQEMTGYVQITRVGKSFEYEYINGPTPVYVNKPKLATGMTAVKWNVETSTWNAVSNPSTDKSWYNYEDKNWANAVTDDCTDPSDLSTCSMWVWVPRYIYKISSGWHTTTAGIIDVQFSKGTDDNWNNEEIGNVNTDATSSSSNNTWSNHPAFKFGDIELTGIWVAKFETSVANQSDPCYTSANSTDCNKTTLIPKYIPNAKTWRYIQIGNMFTVSRNMETNSVYGWGTSGSGIDTHLMKNVEWGAAAYLSKSVFGINGEVWPNPANNYTTGCAGDSVSSSSTTGCIYTYNTANGVNASTAGTIYGIYDMSGGTPEYVAAYVDNGNSILTSNGNSIYTADPKYKDIYTVGSPDTRENNYALAINFKGDAIYETSGGFDWSNGWYSDYSFMPNDASAWFFRGSSYSCGSCAGVFESSANSWGDQNNGGGFRSVLLVEHGL